MGTGTKEVLIALTFDDGPNVASGSTPNPTRKVNKVLTNNKIAAAFFVQAQVSYRMNNSLGEDIIRELFNAGHSIQIHTGSKQDHALYTARVGSNPYDINGDQKVDAADGLDGLQSDMKFAKKAISAAIAKTKGNPTYVPLYARAPTGALGKTAVRKSIIQSLARENLSNVLWNVDSEDNASPHPSTPVVLKNIDNAIKAVLGNTNQTYILALFHDINQNTAKNLQKYIDQVNVSVKKHGRVPRYTSNRAEVDSVLQQHKTTK